MVLAASAPPADAEVVVEPADTRGGFDIGIPPLSGMDS